MSDLYIIRHGIAAERGTYTRDGERPLTEEGRRKTRQVAKRLVELKLQFDLILTSPLVRAQQTAEILQAEGLSARLEVSDYLAPDGSLEAWLAWFNKWQRSHPDAPLAIVGHQPDLGNWAETLVWGQARDGLVLKKAGVIGLTIPGLGQAIANSSLFWLSPPKFLL
ncbi:MULTISPECIES: phosphohistidine phosphatase SixA [Trichocoleus]|uniref:Phosphohistidine phosphatase SixA n=1 Tax=Trichocoleus desertorum GB2-A4 TaxID=2933944 RepID=A0ABV0J8U9_9CYAN|nr:phosphohistidine phosphatase SixA [Trichocoleus sp. FACHB-46]MBD1862498.1 phosphohistidine phosphatase SixA [Trichocoleus sp. FACHB-46]